MTKLYNLNEEVLAKIFSYLDTEEILNVARVSSYCLEVSKHPLLWKRAILHVKRMASFKSFCSFLTEVPYARVRVLFLTFPELRIFEKDEENDLNHLFSNLNQLMCLTVENLVLSDDITLPPNLKHLSFSWKKVPDFSTLIGSGCVISVIHKALVQCPEIKKICVYADDSHILNFESVLAQKIEKIKENASKLTSLAIFPMCSEFMPLIQFFTNLKKLGLYFHYENDYDLVQKSDLVPIKEFQFLELLFLRGSHEFLVLILKAFKNHTLPSIRHFSFLTQSICKLMRKDFKQLHILFPNLETFYANGLFKRNIHDFHEYIKNCSTLKSIYYDYGGSGKSLFKFIGELLRLSETRPFHHICFCSALNKICNPNGNFIPNVPTEIKEQLLKYSCEGEKIHGTELKYAKCFCQFPMLETPGEYQLIPKLSAYPDIDAGEEELVWDTTGVQEDYDDDGE